MHEACSQFFYTVDIITKSVSIIWTTTISKVVLPHPKILLNEHTSMVYF